MAWWFFFYKVKKLLHIRPVKSPGAVAFIREGSYYVYIVALAPAGGGYVLAFGRVGTLILTTEP
jgi:hypothetical protein